MHRLFCPPSLLPLSLLIIRKAKFNQFSMPTQSCCFSFCRKCTRILCTAKAQSVPRTITKCMRAPQKKNKTTPAAAAAAAATITTTVQIVTPHHARQRVSERGSATEQQQESERSPHAEQRNGRDNDIQLELFAHSQALSRSPALSGSPHNGARIENNQDQVSSGILHKNKN